MSRFLLPFLLCSASLFAQTLDTARMSGYLTALAREGKGMGSVSIFESGKEVYRYGFGYADVSKAIRPRPETRYRIGSVTKMFTATVIMRLVEAGRLKLQDRLDRYFPKIPHAHEITIADLLRHGSGLTDRNYLLWQDRGRSFSLSKKPVYANVNYVLLSEIAEQVEGKAFGELMRQQVFEPCGLGRTHFGPETDPAVYEAVSYVRRKSWERVPPNDLSSPAGAGAIVSTPGDLNTFLYCLFSGKLVAARALREMETLVEGYGMGMMSIPFGSHQAFSHAGAIDGFQARVAYFPKDDFSIACCFNGLAGSEEAVLIELLKIYFERKGY